MNEAELTRKDKIIDDLIWQEKSGKIIRNPQKMDGTSLINNLKRKVKE
jgi:hypothetical protein